MNSKRNIYLHTVKISEAVELIKENLNRDKLLKTEWVKTEEAKGRITAEPVFARFSSPTYHSAAMDGIAVRAEETFKAREGNPVELDSTKHQPVNTGDPLPSAFNAVIMIEDVHQTKEDRVSIETPAFPWQHVRKIGEDIVASELIFSQNHMLTAYDIGALLSGGIYELKVKKRLKVTYIPTGDEVLDFSQSPNPEPGQVIESNSQVCRHLLEGFGCVFCRTAPVPDQIEKLSQAVEKALDSDAHIIILGAGSSAGSKDFSKAVMEKFGQVLVHGIAAMPGKPTLAGLAKNKLLIGAPGYPVSSVVCYEKILKPIISWILQISLKERKRINVRLSRKMPSKLGQDEFIRLNIGEIDNTWIAAPLSRGAGLITSLTKAQGWAKVPAQLEGVAQGQEMEAELFGTREDLKKVLICIGSHDNTLDLLANELMGAEEPVSLSSTHVGSMGGISALKDNSAHLCGSHLFDPESQDFNFPFLKKYLPNQEVKVVNLSIRQQGLIIAKGNPKDIQGIEDIKKKSLNYINRQRGAGTRILFEDLIKKAGLTPADIPGYDQEEYTHMAIAVNVLSKTADCGMGIYAAAKALDLDFIPLVKERYDLVIPIRFLEDPRIQTLLSLLQKDEVKKKIESLGGYETWLTGQVMQPGQGIGLIK